MFDEISKPIKMIENVKKLLREVKDIVDKNEQAAIQTGERFNVFSIMSMENNEVYTHSAFIGELLRNNGSHGLRDEPLKLFLQEIKASNVQFFSKINTRNSRVVVEEFHGAISEDKTTGGRIDIVVKDNDGNALVIENKIYATEQENQLIRYSNTYKNQPILFLTLDGRSSNQCGMLKLHEQYFCISYYSTIVNWLRKCIEIDGISVMVREVIRQYLYLILKLMNQNTNKKMNQEVIDVLKKDIPASFEIFGKEKALKESIVKDLNERIKTLTQEKSLIITEGSFSYSYAGSEVYFSKTKWKEQDIYLVFGFEYAGFKDFYAGLYLETKDTVLREIVIRKFKDYKNYEIDGNYAFVYLADGNATEDWVSFDDGTTIQRCKEVIEEVNGFVEQIIK